ncbi:S8 family serine peptidase [Candidatus Woesearchaeota archaeon]|nr:S8 family serine peptidase [Candidatus Woesearchaeota archaeon]MCF7901537.1 S8 family serine peptidase [Candidatus Woesearchaeota archaeon]MCF8013967.1 S8 family serine peptidase [Candidatus Woesearchaeota archaeon]
MKRNILIISVLLVLLLSGLVSAQLDVKEKIKEQGKIRAIVIIKENVQKISPQIQKSKNLRLSRYSKSNKDIAISTVKKDIDKFVDLPLINGFSGIITKEILNDLEKSGVDFEIYEDIQIQLNPIEKTTLQTSISTEVIGANYSWDTLNYTGRNITIGIIDSGIDYTHESLGNCNIKIVNNTGNVIFLNETEIEIVNSTEVYNNDTIESDHNYSNNHHYQWNITMPGFTNISLHFDTIYLETFYNYNPWDVLYIKYPNGTKIANYSGQKTDIWTPHAQGDTIIIDWTTDPNENDYGILVDAVLNGTSSTSYNWSNCNKVVGGYDFINLDEDPYDDHYHGTHVAGIIGGNGTIKGVAPDSKLYALKACERNGGCDSSSIISALQWAVDNNLDLVSMSLGGPANSRSELNSGSSTMSVAVDNAVNAGLIIVVSSGNSGPGQSTTSYPGDAKKVITVGAMDDKRTESYGDDSMASFSNRGPSAFGRLDPELVAPGVDITSTSPGNATRTLDGTSMSAPHVTGAIALLKEKYPNLSPILARAVIMQNTKNMSGKVFDKGTGLVYIKNALENNLYALINATNSYGRFETTDRWEFIADITGKNSANITVYNNNSYPINFTFAFDSFENKDNSFSLNISDFELLNNVSVNASNSETFTINYSISNYSSTYPATYAGLLRLYGNTSNNLTIPIVITIPITSQYNNTKTVNYEEVDGDDEIGDGEHALYLYKQSENSENNISFNWGSILDKYYLGIYNQSGSNLERNIVSGINEKMFSTITSSTDSYRWLSIYTYNVSVPDTILLNITNNVTNFPPEIINITNNNNDTNLTFIRGDSVILKINYEDLENDSVNISINNSVYEIQSNSNNTAIFIWNSSTSCLNNHTILINASDEYGYSSITREINITNAANYPPIILSLPDNNPVANIGENYSFNISSCDVNNNNISYFWYVNGTLNSTNENFTFNVSLFSGRYLNITSIVSNNISNTTNEWTLYKNNPVSFSGTINSRSWDEGSSEDDAFNISTYFSDLDNDSITYTLNNRSSLTMSVADDGYVSFDSPNSYFGVRTVWITANDSYSTANSNIFTLTVEEDTTSTSSSSSTNNDLGGSSSGSSSVQSYYSEIFSSVSGKLSIKPNLETVSISGLEINFKNEKANVKITLKDLELKDQPDFVSKFKLKNYKTLEITHDNFVDSDIDSVKINFKVPSSLILSEGLSRNDIKLFRYNNDAWKELSTKFLKVEDSYYYFQANSPGLSTFIIGYEEKPKEKKEIQKINETSINTVETNKTNETNFNINNESINSTSSFQLDQELTFILGGLILVILIIFGIVLFSHNKSKNKNKVPTTYSEKNKNLKQTNEQNQEIPNHLVIPANHIKSKNNNNNNNNNKKPNNNSKIQNNNSRNYVFSEDAYTYSIRRRFAEKLKKQKETISTKMKSIISPERRKKILEKRHSKDKNEHERIKIE